MATVIAIDLSVSMIRDIKIKDTNESFTLLQLATHGVNVLLDYLAVHSKLEFVAVVSVFLDCLGGSSGGDAVGSGLGTFVPEQILKAFALQFFSGKTHERRTKILK